MLESLLSTIDHEDMTASTATMNHDARSEPVVVEPLLTVEGGGIPTSVTLRREGPGCLSWTPC